MPDLLSVLMVNFVSTLVFFLAAGGAAAWLLGSQFSGSAIRHLIRWTFVALAGGLVFIVVSVTRPDLLARPIHRMTRRLDGDPRAWAQTLRRAGQVLVDSAERYKASCVRCFREWPLLPVASLVLTALLYLNKFTLAWFVVRGLGVDESYTTVLAVQTLLHFVLYVAPTPGGGGLGELSTGAIMAPVLPTYLLPAFTVAFRLFLTYLPAAVGAFVMARMVPRARTVAPAMRVVVGAVAVAVAASALAADASARQVKVRQPPAMVPLADATHHRRAKLVRHALAQGLRAACRDDSLLAFQLAVDTASALVREDPHDAEAHYLYSVALGQRLELAGTREKIRLGALTRAAAENALEIDPDHAGAHHVLGRLHAGTMRLSSFVRFVARRILGAEALAGASWEKAEHHFTRARDLEPWNPRHSMELGVLYADTGRPGLALEALNAAIDLPRARLTDAPAVDRAMRVRAELIAVPSTW
jgi:Flp pilus assembly protein TadD